MTVVDTSGAPISGATVLWIAPQERWFQPWRGRRGTDWEEVERFVRRDRTDDEGTFECDALEELSDSRERVLWIGAPGRMARMFLQPAAVSLPDPIVLDAAPALEATVRLASGALVEGALVHQLTYIESADPARDGDPEARGIRLFHVVHTTDARGHASLLPLPERQVVHAELGGLQSEIVYCEQPAEVTLELTSTFDASGRVEPWPPPGGSSGFVVCRVLRAGIGIGYASVRVGPDGRWGPTRLPRLEADHWNFQLIADRSIPIEHEVDPPEAGRDVRVDFRLEPGIPLVVSVLDEERAPVPGAQLQANWTRSDRWFYAEAFSGPGGEARFEACPQEMIWIRAIREGFVTRVLPAFELHADTAQPVDVVLEKAATLVVRCTSAGEPLRDYDLFYWRDSTSDYEIKAVEGSRDGSATLDNVPPGQVSMFAFGRGTAQSEVVVLHVGPDGPNEVEIDVPVGMGGWGRVIDSLTGEEVEDAEVMVPSVAYGTLMNQRGPTLRTDSDGIFRGSVFGQGGNIVQVSADYYAATTSRAFGAFGTEVDFGTIGLEHLQVLEVVLDPEIEFDMTACRAEIRGRQFRPRQAFDSEGRTSFEGLGPGGYTLLVIRADGLHINVALDLIGGRPWTVRVPIPSMRTVHIEVVPGPDGVLPTGLDVQIDARRPDGAPLTELTGIVDSGVADIPTSAVGTTVFTVIGTEGILAHETVELSEAGGERVEIEVGAPWSVLRVLDTSGNPIPGTVVVVRHPSEVPAWAFAETTGPGGEVRVPMSGDQVYAVDLIHTTRGSALEIPVRFDDEVTELVLDADASVAVRLQDGAQPLVGVQLSIGGKRLDGRVLGWVHTDGEGRARLAGVARGTYRVGVAQAGIWPVEHIVEAREPEQAVEIQARRIGSVEIIARRKGALLAGARVELVDAVTGERVADWVAQSRANASSPQLVTDAKGRLRVDGVPHGRYRWSVDLGADGWRSGELVVPAAAVGEARMDVQ